MTKRERIATRLMVFAAGCLLASAALAMEPMPAPDVAYVPPVAIDSDPDAAALRSIYEAVRGGNWWLAAVLLLVGAVASARGLARRFMPDDVTWKGRVRRWLLSGEGAIALTVIGSLSASTATALGGHVQLDLDWIVTSIKVAIGAAGTVATYQYTVGAKAQESRTERREITGALKAGAVPAPHLESDPRPVEKP